MNALPPFGTGGRKFTFVLFLQIFYGNIGPFYGNASSWIRISVHSCLDIDRVLSTHLLKIANETANETAAFDVMMVYVR